MTFYPDTLYDYLNQENTRAFIKTAKNYLAFCEELVKEEPSKMVLSKMQPHISAIFESSSKLDKLGIEVSGEHKELGRENDGVYDELVDFLNRSINSDTRCVIIFKPYQTDQYYSSFYVNELFTDLYLSFKDFIYRTEVLGSPNEIQASLFFLFHEIANYWGPQCASLLAAYADDSSEIRKIALNISGQNLNLN